jgi:hypothetical protein
MTKIALTLKISNASRIYLLSYEAVKRQERDEIYWAAISVVWDYLFSGDKLTSK